jgi:hypothetical protein
LSRTEHHALQPAGQAIAVAAQFGPPIEAWAARKSIQYLMREISGLGLLPRRCGADERKARGLNKVLVFQPNCGLMGIRLLAAL